MVNLTSEHTGAYRMAGKCSLDSATQRLRGRGIYVHLTMGHITYQSAAPPYAGGGGCLPRRRRRTSGAAKLYKTVAVSCCAGLPSPGADSCSSNRCAAPVKGRKAASPPDGKFRGSDDGRSSPSLIAFMSRCVSTASSIYSKLCAEWQKVHVGRSPSHMVTGRSKRTKRS